LRENPAAAAEAPGRVNLLGEHTDYNDGFVLAAAVEAKTRVALRRSGRKVFRLHSAGLAHGAQFSLQAPPSEHFASYVYGCLKVLAQRALEVPPLDIEVQSSLPMKAGLGSSAALEVATLRALRLLLGLPLDDMAIAQLAQQAEVEYAGAHCGIVEQMASSLARPGEMLFLDTRTLERAVLPLPRGCELLVLDSGAARPLAHTGYSARRAQCGEAARLLGVHALRDVTDARRADELAEPLGRRVRHVVSENARVLAALNGVDARELGELMNASHRSLREDCEVSLPELDELVALLQTHPDVHGARLTGGGFRGTCVALCRAGEARAIAAAVVERYNAAGRRARVLVPEAAALVA
jgi:galactokinase